MVVGVWGDGSTGIREVGMVSLLIVLGIRGGVLGRGEGGGVDTMFTNDLCFFVCGTTRTDGRGTSAALSRFMGFHLEALCEIHSMVTVLFGLEEGA